MLLSLSSKVTDVYECVPVQGTVLAEVPDLKELVFSLGRQGVHKKVSGPGYQNLKAKWAVQNFRNSKGHRT